MGCVEVGDDKSFVAENAKPRDVHSELPPVEADVAAAFEQLSV
jgi:hypothetical protein